MKKKLLFICLLLCLCFAFKIENVNALSRSIEVGGETLDNVVSTNTDETAFYDYDDNVLTLKNYDGGPIQYYDIDSLTVVLTENNTITSDFMMEGFLSCADITFEGQGTLLIKNAYTGIMVYDGDLKINNNNLIIENVFEQALSVMGGKIIINGKVSIDSDAELIEQELGYYYGYTAMNATDDIEINNDVLIKNANKGIDTNGNITIKSGISNVNSLNAGIHTAKAFSMLGGKIDIEVTSIDNFLPLYGIEAGSINIKNGYLHVLVPEDNIGIISWGEVGKAPSISIDDDLIIEPDYTIIDIEPVPEYSAKTLGSTSSAANEVTIYDKKTVTFNTNGGSNIDEQKLICGSLINVPESPVKSGYTFDGWYQDIALNIPFDFNTSIVNDVTLYAKWTANEYKITFDANEGAVTPNNKNVTFGGSYGELPVPTRNGYTFDGWYTAKENGTKITSDTIVTITNAQTLYARWIANEYNIIITINDEDMGSASANLTKANEGTKISLTALPKTGYHFVKWESSDVTITNNEFIMPPKNVTVKVIFEEDIPLTYKVSFDKNGGTGSMNDITGLTGTYTLPENKFAAPDGKKFKGWSLSNDGGIITKLDIDEDKIVYAIWENIPDDYSYEFKKGNNQKLIINNINSYTFTIDGDYSLFENVKIGNLDLIKDEDYEVTEGSTVITFTDKGIAKLNNLSKGEYEILVKYTNSKEVKGKVILNSEIENPKTGDNYTTYIITGILSLIGLIGISFYTRKKLVK